ncbi:glycosyltransferase [Fictibacillus iocasae]|uniref:Glycosyltransferase n=1 Tax=Fictibacillus iocasae TaxID=2715437 RepID=A0ABW2NR74_9BACL
MKVSACLIAKNESKNIQRCLQSLMNVSDEIILVDTGSTDDTVKIAKEQGAKVFPYKWDNNFANAKNYALNLAKGDWIVFLDADEYLEKSTEKNLRQVLSQIHSKKKYDTVQCRMIHTNGYKGNVISENPAIRIFRNDKQTRFEGAIHEKPLKNSKPLNSVLINNFELIIYHTGYELSILQTKFKRNLALLKTQEKNNQIDHMTYYYLSASYSNLGRDDLAIKYAKLALEEPKMNKTTVAFKPYVFLIKGMFGMQGNVSKDELETYVNKALELFPNHPEIWRLNAIHKKEKNQYQLAIESYNKALECHYTFDNKMLNDFPIYIEEVYSELASLSYLVGNHTNVLEFYFRVLNINKKNKIAFEGLIEITKNQNLEDVLFFLNSIYDKNNQWDLEFLALNLEKVNIYASLYYRRLLDLKLGIENDDSIIIPEQFN